MNIIYFYVLKVKILSVIFGNIIVITTKDIVIDNLAAEPDRNPLATTAAGTVVVERKPSAVAATGRPWQLAVAFVLKGPLVAVAAARAGTLLTGGQRLPEVGRRR